MKTVINYLDELKEQTGSDYKSAKALVISKEGVSKIRKRGQMSDETAIKIAQLLDIDESEVLIAAAVARSQGEVKKAWEKISKRAGIAAGFLLYFYMLTPYFAIIAKQECILC